MKVASLSLEGINRGTQRPERDMPGIGEDDKPEDTSHDEVIDDDKYDDTGEIFTFTAE